MGICTATHDAAPVQELAQLAAKALAPLPVGGASSAASQWLTAAAAAVSDAAPRLLASAASAAELAAAEAAARAAIAAWSGGDGSGKQPPSRQPLQPLQLSQVQPVSLAQQPAGLAAAAQKPQRRDWAAVAAWVLGQRCDVLQAVFEASFLRRGRELIAAAFAQVWVAHGVCRQCCWQRLHC